MTVCVLWTTATKAVNYLGQVCRQNLVWRLSNFCTCHWHSWIMTWDWIFLTNWSKEENVWISSSCAPFHAAWVEFYSSAFITLLNAICCKEMQINVGAHIQIVGCWGTHILAWTKINLRERKSLAIFPTLLLQTFISCQWSMNSGHQNSKKKSDNFPTLNIFFGMCCHFFLLISNLTAMMMIVAATISVFASFRLWPSQDGGVGGVGLGPIGNRDDLPICCFPL